jgi:hypothetical protein
MERRMSELNYKQSWWGKHKGIILTTILIPILLFIGSNSYDKWDQIQDDVLIMKVKFEVLEGFIINSQNQQNHFTPAPEGGDIPTLGHPTGDTNRHEANQPISDETRDDFYEEQIHIQAIPPVRADRIRKGR